MHQHLEDARRDALARRIWAAEVMQEEMMEEVDCLLELGQTLPRPDMMLPDMML